MSLINPDIVQYRMVSAYGDSQLSLAVQTILNDDDGWIVYGNPVVAITENGYTLFGQALVQIMED